MGYKESNNSQNGGWNTGNNQQSGRNSGNSSQNGWNPNNSQSGWNPGNSQQPGWNPDNSQQNWNNMNLNSQWNPNMGGGYPGGPGKKSWGTDKRSNYCPSYRSSSDCVCCYFICG